MAGRCRTCGMLCAGDYCDDGCFIVRAEWLPPERTRAPERAAVALAKYYNVHRIGRA